MIRSVSTTPGSAVANSPVPPTADTPFWALPAFACTGRLRFAERQRILVRNPRPLGTNGYSTSWGTNAHGELSACPPGRG